MTEFDDFLQQRIVSLRAERAETEDARRDAESDEEKIALSERGQDITTAIEECEEKLADPELVSAEVSSAVEAMLKKEETDPASPPVVERRGTRTIVREGRPRPRRRLPRPRAPVVLRTRRLVRGRTRCRERRERRTATSSRGSPDGEGEPDPSGARALQRQLARAVELAERQQVVAEGWRQAANDAVAVALQLQRELHEQRDGT